MCIKQYKPIFIFNLFLSCVSYRIIIWELKMVWSRFYNQFLLVMPFFVYVWCEYLEKDNLLIRASHSLANQNHVRCMFYIMFERFIALVESVVLIFNCFGTLYLLAILHFNYNLVLWYLHTSIKSNGASLNALESVCTLYKSQWAYWQNLPQKHLQ